jgi:hypothetical protein
VQGINALIFPSIILSFFISHRQEDMEAVQGINALIFPSIILSFFISHRQEDMEAVQAINALIFSFINIFILTIYVAQTGIHLSGARD